MRGWPRRRKERIGSQSPSIDASICRSREIGSRRYEGRRSVEARLDRRYATSGAASSPESERRMVDPASPIGTDQRLAEADRLIEHS